MKLSLLIGCLVFVFFSVVFISHWTNYRESVLEARGAGNVIEHRFKFEGTGYVLERGGGGSDGGGGGSGVVIIMLPHTKIICSRP